MVDKREGMKFVQHTDHPIVSMIEYNERIYVATERQVLVLNNEGKLIPIEILND